MNITLRDTPCALGFQSPMSGVSSIVATIYACLDNLAHVIGQGQVWASQVEDVRPTELSFSWHGSRHVSRHVTTCRAATRTTEKSNNVDPCPSARTVVGSWGFQM